MLPGLVLVILIFWALAAVLMLTGTLINANEIKDTVDVINAEVSSTDGIDKDLDSVAELEQTRKTVASIRDAADPLSGQATQIITAALAINRSARSILGTAGSINTTAKSINGTVRSINASVGSIGGNVVQINQRVNSIGGSVFAINSRARSIFAAVGPPGATDSSSIKASVARILRQLRALDPVTRSIDNGQGRRTLGPKGVSHINRRASIAIDLARGIKGDFGQILTGVRAIDVHANSIDCARLINLVGPTQSCTLR